MIKKCKTKRRTKTMKIKDEKGKRMTNYRKDIKKEKENKDTNKKLRVRNYLQYVTCYMWFKALNLSVGLKLIHTLPNIKCTLW